MRTRIKSLKTEIEERRNTLQKVQDNCIELEKRKSDSGNPYALFDESTRASVVSKDGMVIIVFNSF